MRRWGCCCLAVWTPHLWQAWPSGAALLSMPATAWTELPVQQTWKSLRQQLTAMAFLRRHLKEARNAYDTQHKLHTFSVGLPNSPDLIAARKVSTCNAQFERVGRSITQQLFIRCAWVALNRWQTSWAQSTTSSRSRYKRAWMHWKTSSGTSSPSSRCRTEHEFSQQKGRCSD